MYKKEQLKLLEEKENQIKNILLEGDITYGMAKHIIQRIDADLLKEGEMFLRGALLKKHNALRMIIYRHLYAENGKNAVIFYGFV